ncbi:MAG: hypothetical protein AB2A00_33570 [Myxococcota bacterium]
MTNSPRKASPPLDDDEIDAVDELELEAVDTAAEDVDALALLLVATPPVLTAELEVSDVLTDALLEVADALDAVAVDTLDEVLTPLWVLVDDAAVLAVEVAAVPEELAVLDVAEVVAEVAADALLVLLADVVDAELPLEPAALLLVLEEPVTCVLAPVPPGVAGTQRPSRQSSSPVQSRCALHARTQRPSSGISFSWHRTHAGPDHQTATPNAASAARP